MESIKKIWSKLVLACICVSVIQISSAQIGGKIGASFYRPKQIQKMGPIAEKKIVIARHELSKRALKKHSKSGNLKKVQAEIEEADIKFFELVKSHWPEAEVVLGSPYEVESNKKDNSILVLKNMLRTDVQSKTNSMTKVKKTFRYSYSCLELYAGGTLVAWFTNTGGNLTDLDIKLGLNFLIQEWTAALADINNDGFDEYINMNAELLKTKTLLIPEGVCKMNEDDIKEKYPHQIRLVALEEIIARIKEESADYLFYLPYHDIGSCGKRFIHIVYSCENLQAVALTKGAAVQFGDFAGHAGAGYEIMNLLEFTGGGSLDVPYTKLLKKGSLKDLGEL